MSVQMIELEEVQMVETSDAALEQYISNPTEYMWTVPGSCS